MGKAEDLAAVVQQRMQELYSPGNEKKAAIFEALTIRDAIRRGDNVGDAMQEIEALRLLGGMNNAPELKEIEQNIADNLTKSGKSKKEVEEQLSDLKQIGLLWAGNNVSIQAADTVAPSHTPNVAAKDGPDPPPR